jgi:transposase
MGKIKHDYTEAISLYNEGAQLREISEKTQIPYNTLLTFLTRGFRVGTIKTRTKRIDRSGIIDLYKEGFSHIEIAQKLGITSVSSSSYINRFVKNGESKRKVHLKKQGERHNRAKLTEEDIKKIYSLRLKGTEYLEIAIAFNVHPTNVGYICTGKSWKSTFENFGGELKNIIPQKRRKKKVATKTLQPEFIQHPTALCPICSNPYPCEHTK